MERFVHRGGNYNNTSNAGPRYSNANNRRSNSNAFRLVFIDRQFHDPHGVHVSAFDKKSLTPSLTRENMNRCVRPVGFARPPYRTTFIMKTYNNLWDRIISFENLLNAYRLSSKQKHYRPEVLEFAANLEENLIGLQNELIWGLYTPSPPRQFYVFEPKKRLITAPAFKDRVVHHALCSVIEPILDRRFIYDSFACRVGKGNTKVVDRLQDLARKAKRLYGDYYAFKGDIKSFFPSINIDILKKQIAGKISDSNVLNLINVILDAGGPIGLPIGALTSQLFANYTLDLLDHFVKEALGVRFYVRYMDDFVVLAKTAKDAKAIGVFISNFVQSSLGLSMNPKSTVLKGSSGIPFCGFRVWPTHKTHLKPSFKRSVRRLRKLAYLHNLGCINKARFKQSLMSFLGHYKHCNSCRSLDSALNKIVIRRGL